MAEIIVALDLPDPGAALRLVDALPDLRWVKIGPMLFVRDGPGLLGELKHRGIRVFLDLKWYDIPNSVGEAAAAAAELGVDLATVHALGGADMVRAAVDRAGKMRIAAVSVLTSFGAPEYWRTIGRTDGYGDLTAEVLRLARVAAEAGAGAIVGSPQEVQALKAVIGPDRWIVTPGIRPAGAAADDQRRSADPEAAVRAGATHLVVGRPITRADRPREVYEMLVRVARTRMEP